MKVPAWCLVTLLALCVTHCKESEPSSEGCAEGQTPVGQECALTRIGPESCGALLRREGTSCVVDLPECSDEQIYTPEGCAEVGVTQECGSGDWGHIDLGGTVVFVNIAYDGGDPDGSEARPFTTIAEALAAATAGATVAIAEGTYEENLVVPAEVTLAGRCPELVTIRGTGEEPALVIEDADGAAIRGVTVEASGIGIDVASSREVVIEQVLVTAASGVAIRFDQDAAGIIGDCGIVGTTRASDELRGFGLLVGEGASVEVRSSVLSGNASSGVRTDSGNVTLDQCLVRENRGAGVILNQPAGPVVVRGSRLAGNGRAGMVVIGGGEVGVEGSVIEGSYDVEESDEPNGDGILAQAGATVSVTDSVIRSCLRFGLFFFEATGIIGDCGIVGNGAATRDNSSAGGLAASGATLEVRECSFSDNNGGGIQVWGGEISVTDSLVEGTRRRRANAPEGDGIMAADGADLSVDRTLIDARDGGRLGILLYQDATGIIGDCGIVGTQYSGVWFHQRSTGAVRRTVVTEASLAGVGLGMGSGAGGSAGVEISDCIVSNIHPAPSVAAGEPVDWGDGVVVTNGSVATVSGNTIRTIDRVGVILDNSTATVTDNDIQEAEFGIALQDSTVTERDNTISHVDETMVEDRGLPIFGADWTDDTGG